MDLEELRALLGVAEHRSFLQAATELGTSRSTLRRRVEALEARTGASLLVRTRTGIELTEAGQLVVSEGMRLVEDANRLMSSISQLQSEPSGPLVGIMEIGIPEHVQSVLFAHLAATFPKVRFEVRYEANPTKALTDDVEFCTYSGRTPLSGPWVSLRAATAPTNLVASQRYLEEHGMPGSIEELRRHRLAVWTLPGEDARLLPLVDGRLVEIDPVLCTSNANLVRACVVTGKMIGFMPLPGLPGEFPDEAGCVTVMPKLVGGEIHNFTSFRRGLEGGAKVNQVLAEGLRLSHAVVGKAAVPGAAKVRVATDRLNGADLPSRRSDVIQTTLE